MSEYEDELIMLALILDDSNNFSLSLYCKLKSVMILKYVDKYVIYVIEVLIEMIMHLY